MKLLMVVLALTLAGCELVQTRAQTDDDKHFKHDCVLTHADGSTMSCSQHLSHDQDSEDKDTGASVVMPVPVPVPVPVPEAGP